MRTTVDLAPPLLTKVKRLVAERGSTLSEVVSEALGAYLGATQRRVPDAPFNLIVRGRPGARFPSPDEIATLEDEEDVVALRVQRTPRRAAP